MRREAEPSLKPSPQSPSQRLEGVKVSIAQNMGSTPKSNEGAPDRQPQSVFVCHSPNAAPVGSSMMLSQPMSGTSIESFTIFAPSDFAFCVAAPMSSTRTYASQNDGMPGIGFLSNPPPVPSPTLITV